MAVNDHAQRAFGLQGLDNFLFNVSGDGEFEAPERPGAHDERGQDAAGRGLGISDAATRDDLFAGGEDGPEMPDLPDDAPFTPAPDLIGAAGLSFTDDFGQGRGGVPGPNGGGGGGGGGGDGGGDGADGGVVDSYTSGLLAGNLSDFNIEIVFKGSWTATLQESFIQASELLSNIITGDISNVRFRGKTIDDVRIEAKLSDIDGSGGILGQAGPTAYRTLGFLPAAGIMEFDSSDAEDFDGINLFNDIVFHEMMHVLGFGTMWDEMGLVTDTGGALTFDGSAATIEALAEFGLTDGPLIETDGGPGTAGGHWNEDNDSDGLGFANEIMTGYINNSNYLSDTTIAALDDMGYETVYAAGVDVVGTTDTPGIVNQALHDAVFLA